MGKKADRNSEWQLAKARTRGYLTVHGEVDRETVKAWTAACAANGHPLIIVSLIDNDLGFLVTDGITDEQSREILREAVKAAQEVDEQHALFPIDRENDGVTTIGPLPAGRILAIAIALAGRAKAQNSAQF